MKKIPKFSSEDEEARFWGTHSPLDYSDEFTDIRDPFEFVPELLKEFDRNQEEKKRHLTLRMEQRQIDLAKVIAKWKGLGYQTQMRMWIIEGIRKEIAAHPELRDLGTMGNGGAESA